MCSDADRYEPIKEGVVTVHDDTDVLTRLTELKALPACQLLVQDASQDGGQQQDRPAHGWVVGGDQGVGHEGYTTFGCGCVTYGRRKYRL